MMFRSLALIAALGFAGAAQAHDFEAGGLTVLHPFAIETASRATTGAGYLTIRNEGETADALIGVEADFPKVTLHESVEADGMMTMQPLERIDIAPGETVTLAPGMGGHVMFMGLEAPFETGARFPATLIFEEAGEVAVEFVVEARPEAEGGMDHGVMGHDDMDHDAMDHGDMGHDMDAPADE
ncbi:copper chaperone PCu(A)C [Limimaricola litoreus]|uniref:Copper chaperone PCu(A)C n=1 Tax=Limimaricola litoreus TaxID=2955316 RepID=A0A9X2FUT7_9RHOB|nr:copper chaperone PCu(A)C [Limimaricola litoreus]MCP1167583.1 copper chaperone PCu(A)C [Limimaricola litoreus]